MSKLSFRIRTFGESLTGSLLSPLISRLERTPVFIVGCQRSGTTMLQTVLSRSPAVSAHSETHRSVFDSTHLRSIGNVRYRVLASKRPVVEFKPLNDAQHTDKLLAIHPDAKAIWIYRDYNDVANSMVRKWGSSAQAQVSEIATGVYTNRSRQALGERISPENHETLRQMIKDPVNEYEAAVLIWYIRNALCFDRGLQANRSAIICRYEDLVTDPRPYFEAIFGFIQTPFDYTFIQDVHSSSVQRNTKPIMRPDIASLCNAMLDSLDEHRMIIK